MLGKNTYVKSLGDEVTAKIGLNQDLQHTDKLNPEKESLKISAIYLLVGAVWILMSDKALAFLVSNKEALTNISMLKGWFYVLITGILVYSLVCSALNRIKTAESNLYISYERLMENQQKLKEYEKELIYQAYHDQLTGLPNRRALINSLNNLVRTKKSEKIALIIVDIDNFKYINDTMGHSFGDNLLYRVSERLESLVEADCAIYRLCGDEFVILLENYQDSTVVESLAVKLLKGCGTRYDIDASGIFLSISIGVSLYPEHGENLDELLTNADIAVHKAKETGRDRIVFFNKSMNDALSERVLIEKHLRAALDNDEFALHYQPQLDITANKVTGLEALIRWESPELGFVSPLKFINIAEDTHLIIPIGEWVLKNACAFIKSLHMQGHESLTMSVNISMLQLLQEDFVYKLMSILDNTDLDPKYLELEITESILMESYEAIEGKLKLLKNKGVNIALDDFGKGYSSLNYLKQLPITTLKIDKSFVDTISSLDKNKSLTNLIVKIGRTMGLCVVAEGVETQEQLDYLMKHKCSKIQGYLFSKPVPEEKIIEAITARVEVVGKHNI